MAKYTQLDDRAWLRERVERRATVDSIAAEVGCGATTVRRALQRHGLLGGRLRHGEPPPRPLKLAAADSGPRKPVP